MGEAIISRNGSSGGNSGVGLKTSAGGEIFNDYEGNKALGEHSFAGGSDNTSGYYGFAIISASNSSMSANFPNSRPIYALDNEYSAANVYEVGDIVSFRTSDDTATKHYYNRYKIVELSGGFIVNQENGQIATIIHVSTIDGSEIVDSFHDGDVDSESSFIYVIGKPYGIPVGLSEAATTLGARNIATGHAAAALNADNQAIGDYALATGRGTKAGYAAFAGGRGTEALYNRSVALGYGTKTGRTDQVVIGKYNKVDKDSLLVVGGGTGDAESTRENVFAVGPNGEVFAKRGMEIEGYDITDRFNEAEYQINSPDKFKIVEALPSTTEEMSNMYLMKSDDNNSTYSKYIYNDAEEVIREKSAVWDGTLVEPIANSNGIYEIDSAEKLAYIIYNGGNIGDQSNCNFVLTKDIYLNDPEAADWSTGTVKSGYTLNKWYSTAGESGVLVADNFSGSIDGNYHTIYGIYNPYKWSYSAPSASTATSGLIPRTKEGGKVVIKNINIDYSFIKARAYAGAILGTGYCEVEIDNCAIGENVYIGSYCTGAIRGGGRSTSSSIKINNCYSHAHMDLAGSNGNLPTYTGICGYYWDSIAEINCCYNSNGPIASIEYGNLYIKDCYATENDLELNGVIVLTVDNMQGEDCFVNENKMPLLDKLHAFKATDTYPIIKYSRFAWIKLDDGITKEYVADAINEKINSKIVAYSSTDTIPEDLAEGTIVFIYE